MAVGPFRARVEKGFCRIGKRAINLLMSSGWAVNVKKGTSDDLGSSKTYYTRVPGRQDSQRAVREHLALPMHVIEARSTVQSSVFDALGIPVGGILLKVQ